MDSHHHAQVAVHPPINKTRWTNFFEGVVTHQRRIGTKLAKTFLQPYRRLPTILTAGRTLTNTRERDEFRKRVHQNIFSCNFRLRVTASERIHIPEWDREAKMLSLIPSSSLRLCPKPVTLPISHIYDSKHRMKKSRNICELTLIWSSLPPVIRQWSCLLGSRDVRMDERTMPSCASQLAVKWNEDE